jgi:hypothetical protein
MQWEIRHLAGDDIIAVRITGTATVERMAGMCTEARTLAARHGAIRFLVDVKLAHCTEGLDALERALSHALITSPQHRLALIGDPRSLEDSSDESPDFGALRLQFTRASAALYWLAGRNPRHHAARALIPAAA